MPTGITDLGAYFQQTQVTLFERLTQAGRNWKCYFYDFPSSWLLLRNLLPQHVLHYRPIDDFFNSVRDERASRNSFSWNRSISAPTRMTTTRRTTS